MEHPTGIAGSFEKSNLELPPEVVISEMRNHQRYFAVVDARGRLQNRFVAVSGTPVKDPAVARHGYERVLRARLADARFFFEEDRKRKLVDRIEDLGRRTYQARLGSELDRVHRIGAVASDLARALGDDALVPDALEAARLCKTDLTTGMVGEFPELQGTMGGHYARLEGLRPAIADAIEDHYKPLGASEEMPRGDLGAIVGVADRLHQLVGIIGVGEKATGAADPYGLRRAAIGILRIVQARGWHLSLATAVERTLDALSTARLAADRAVVASQVREFLRGRLRALWGDEFPGDLVDAVIAAGFDDVVDARQRLEALASIKSRPDFVPLAVAFKRVANIREKAGEGTGRRRGPGPPARGGRDRAARRPDPRGGRGRRAAAVPRLRGGPACGRLAEAGGRSLLRAGPRHGRRPGGPREPARSHEAGLRPLRRRGRLPEDPGRSCPRRAAREGAADRPGFPLTLGGSGA